LSRAPKVLFVSKPIVPPWHDGSKNLVRDVASHLTKAIPTVLTTEGAPSLGERVTLDPTYRDGGAFSPSLLANARVFRRLLTDRDSDIWHFVFAPNAASSGAARAAIAARRALGWKGKVVQTVASAPKRFELVRELLFGDVVVTLSEWMRARLMAEGVEASRMRVIPPSAPRPREVSAAECSRLREELDLGPGPLFVYPGDYETSQGAETVARAASLLGDAAPGMRIVFACRPKSKRTADAQRALDQILADDHAHHYARHVGKLDDIAPLLTSATAVLFPVDDLYGKVDLPIVLLEALSRGVPLVLARGGPLEAIEPASFVDAGDARGLAQAAIAVLHGDREALTRRAKRFYESHFAPEIAGAAHDALYADLMRA
jgi:glycosyltransferase involved in cell wall biosynthesis